MEEKKFTIGDAFKYGFNTFINHFRTLGLGFLAAAVTYIIVFLLWLIFAGLLLLQFYPEFIRIFATSNLSPILLILYAKSSTTVFIMLFNYLLVLFVYYGLLGGFIKLCLNIYDTGKGKVSDIFSSLNITPKLWAAGVLYTLIAIGWLVLLPPNFLIRQLWTVGSPIIVVGLIFLGIPSIYLAIRFTLVAYFIVDKNTSIIEAFRNSYKATTGHFLEIFIIELIIAFLSLIPIGSLILTFFWPIIFTYIYRKLA